MENNIIKVFVYVFDTLADWEIGFVTAELSSKRYFKKTAKEIILKTVGNTKEPIKTMGGLTIIPDLLVTDIVIDSSSVLILPGGNTWNEAIHNDVIEVTKKLISVGGTVCAICGATIALANAGLLNNIFHTSNALEVLEMFSTNYTGRDKYLNVPSVTHQNIITASSSGSLLWSKQIIRHLGVFEDSTLEAWYNYFNTGKPEFFFALMQSMQ